MPINTPDLARGPQPGLARGPQSASIGALGAQFDQTMEIPQVVLDTISEMVRNDFPEEDLAAQKEEYRKAVEERSRQAEEEGRQPIPKQEQEAYLQELDEKWKQRSAYMQAELLKTARAFLPYKGEESLDALVAAVYQRRSELLNGMVMDDLLENQKRNGDLQDVRNMLAAMGALLAGKKGDDPIDVEDTWLVPDPHSQLGKSTAEGKELLAELAKDPEFRKWCEARKLDPNNVRMDSDGRIGVRRPDTMEMKFTVEWFSADDLPASTQQTIKDLGLLDAARIIGGTLRSDGSMSLDEMLAYYGVKPSNPKTADEGMAAVESLKGISDTYGSKSQVEMVKLQQSMGKLDITYSEWKKMFDQLLSSKQGMLR